MNTKKSNISKPHVLILKLNDKLDLRRGVKSIALYQIFALITPWNAKFELPNGSYCLSYIQDYF